ncbi:hypothetical protein IG631_10874 [Alternaria alternata]|nr:hypothetical protein IG631_10874 [Alternaria alternata]
MVDAVQLDNVTGKHVDALLDLSACSDIRLVGLSSTQWEQRIEEIIREEWPVDSYSVSCRTFKKLQVYARLWIKVLHDKMKTALEAYMSR